MTTEIQTGEPAGDGEPIRERTVTVSAEALHQVLTAIMGPGYLIRELQATIGPLFDNPITKLIEQFNEQVAQ